MKFDVIIADPPWPFNDKLTAMKSKTKRSAQSQYSLLSMSDIKGLDVSSLSNDTGCLLALWVPSTLLQDGLETMSSWGFTFKQTFVWVKLKKSYKKETDVNNVIAFGMGRLFRQCHELVLIGTKGKMIYKNLANKSQRSVCLSENLGHSIKPNDLHDRLELMFPNANKLELFARRTKQNWMTLGNEIDGKDIVTAINDVKLI